MLFFLRVFKNTGGNFTVDVIMKGSQEECEGFLVEASVIDAKSENSKVAFKSTFTPRLVCFMFREVFKKPSNGKIPLRGGGGTPLFP